MKQILAVIGIYLVVFMGLMVWSVTEHEHEADTCQQIDDGPMICKCWSDAGEPDSEDDNR